MEADRLAALGVLVLLEDEYTDFIALKRREREEEDKDEEPVPKKPRVHSCWVQEFIKRRQLAEHNTHFSLMIELELKDNMKEMSRMLRMDTRRFYLLLDYIYPEILKQDTNWRKAIPPSFRLCVALKYYSSGLNFIDICHTFRIGEKTARSIVYEVSNAIYNTMQEEYLKCPNTRQEWLDVAEGFRDRWNFPNCLGALDGKHIALQVPPRSGSVFHNYKGGFSVILMALCNANYEFMFVECGAEGRVGDASVWNNCDFKSAMDDNLLGMPVQGLLPATKKMAPFSIVADDAFMLTPRLQKPYGSPNLTLRERVYNYRLSRSRRVSENCFGILANRFRCLRNPLHMLPRHAVEVVLACIVLHNFLRREMGGNYIHPVADPGQWDLEESMSCLESLDKNKSNNPKIQAKDTRDLFADYFMTKEGMVPWQWRKAQVTANLTLPPTDGQDG